jgi:hypothetical protein
MVRPSNGTATGSGAVTEPGQETGAGSMTAEWPKKAADTVDLVVDFVHDKAIRPIVLAARFIVFGLLIAVLAPVVVLLVSVALLRVLDVYAFGGRVWISYFVVGGLFTAFGLLAWSLAGSRTGAAES